MMLKPAAAAGWAVLLPIAASVVSSGQSGHNGNITFVNVTKPNDKIVPFKPTSPSPFLPCLPEFCHYVSRRLKIEMSSPSI